MDQEWLISKRLATENRLSSRWKGSNPYEGVDSNSSSFAVIETVDFRKLINQADKQRHFNISACSNYLLLIVGKDIFVYSLVEPASSLLPVARLIAGRRIIAASMDTSSGREAVAALLEGRIGISWDLNHRLPSTANATQGEPRDLELKTDIHQITNPGISGPIPMQDLSRMAPLEQSQYFLTRATTAPDPLPYSVYSPDETVASVHGVVSCHTESPESTSPWLDEDLDKAADLQLSIDGTDATPGPIDIITRAASVYTNLGTTGDTPRSVAICPQRKCVAFGCRSGIELHWIDAVTGASLNRWFPLAAPSDHLYFLPQRADLDSTRKLRLISSAASPVRVYRERHDSVPIRWKLRSTTPRHGRMQSMTRLFFGNLPFPNALSRDVSSPVFDEQDRHGVLRTIDCDHYRAVPLSDGSHVLFTDPTTGLLCLGSDAPLGGPTKLMRKVCMIPPPSNPQEGASHLTLYRAGHDLRWGVRVIAIYDDGRVVLYNIPANHFERIRYVRATPDIWDELAGVFGESDLLMDVFMSNSNELAEEVELQIEGSRRSSHSSTSFGLLRSLQIDGQEIWRSEVNIEDIQVECAGGGVKVWLFLSDGLAKRLSIYTPKVFNPLESYIGVDGLVYERSWTQKSTHVDTSKKGKDRTYSTDDWDIEGPNRVVKFKVDNWS